MFARAGPWPGRIVRILIHKKVLTEFEIIVIIRYQKEENIMSLDKAIAHNKEHRKIYYGAKSIDRTCCNHGSCAYCQANRQYKNKKRLASMVDKMKEM